MLASLASSQPFVIDADPHQPEIVSESKLEAAIVTPASLPCALVDWDGTDDPGNPKTWSMTSRAFHTAIPALFGLAASFGTSVYSAGVLQIAEQFQVSRTVAISGISLYGLGTAFGTMMGGPISEFQGRKAVYIFTLPIFILFTMGTGISQNIASLLTCRFFAALFGSPALAVSAGTVADVWDMEHGGGLAAVLVTQVAFLGPTIGPLVGGFVMQTQHDWRWTMWATLLFTSPVAVAVLISKETSKKQILKRRSRERGCLSPPKLTLGQALQFFITVTLFRPIRMLLTEPILSSITIYNAFVFGVLFAFFGSYPYVFNSVYGFDNAEIGLAFIGILIGTLLAVVTYMIVDKTFYTQAKIHAPNGKPAPEERLYTAMLGSFGIPVSLFWFGWTARADVHWIVPIIAGIPFGWGTVAVLLGCMTYLIDTYGALYGASAIAANTLVRYSVGAAFPLFIVQMYEKLGIAWASSLVGFFGVALLPIPWVLYKWGPFLRSKSSFQA